ncbi:nucleotidyltransferase domain-containing protein [Nocardiopsis alba]|uniref:Nucleotidyltransferase domain-containing protein n=1 Tax=Nocardiopsis alba TaxID=53437 RepID=A0ABV5DVX3_9ACTN
MSDLIDPSSFPIPETKTYTLDYVAGKLTRQGDELTTVVGDITSAWSGLEDCYSAPESADLYTVLSPLTGDAEEVATALSTTGDALSTFAERVAEIKRDWYALRTEAREFLSSIDYGEKEGWRDGSGIWFWKEESPDVVKHNELIKRGNDLVEAYEEAARDCANAITSQFDGTVFVPNSADGTPPGEGQFAYGFDGSVDVPTEWGSAQKTDHAWYNDAGDAVGDFVVGIGEDLGGAIGIHSATNGWFGASWGDNLAEYWGDAFYGAAAMAGFSRDEEGWGWSGSTMKDSWRDAAHAMVPWEEWGERPWYTIGTAALNIGSVVAGVALSATGVGAVVGAPLLAWRGSKVLSSVGGGRTPDLDTPDTPRLSQAELARIPRYGDGPVTPVDLSGVDAAKLDTSALGRMNESLERLSAARSGGGDGSGSGRPGGSETDTQGTGARPTTAGSTPDTERTERRSPTGRKDDETENPTAGQLQDTQDFLDGIDQESTNSVREGAQREQDKWVAEQTVPDDASSLYDTPVQRYESEPSRVEAPVQEKVGAGVGAEGRGLEVNASDNNRVTNNTDTNGSPMDTPRTGGSGGGGHHLLGSDSGRGGTLGGNGSSGGGGGTGGPGNGNGGVPGGRLPDDSNSGRGGILGSSGGNGNDGSTPDNRFTDDPRYSQTEINQQEENINNEETSRGDQNHEDKSRSNENSHESDTKSDYRDGPPQGVPEEKFIEATNLINDYIGESINDIVVQGSRAGGTARLDSDIDIAARVSKEEFDNLISERFKSPNPGSAKERTMLHAVETGKIQSGEAGLRPLRRKLEKLLEMQVDISFVLREGPFDNPPFIRMK